MKPQYTCEACGIGFGSYNPTPRFCSLRCKGDAQTTSVDPAKIEELYEEGKTQTEIAKVLGVSQKVIWHAMKRHGIAARAAAPRDQAGEKNNAWKGSDAGYAALHKRLYALHGKPNKCSVCGATEAGSFDYANLTGEYEDVDDYAAMCRSCHWKHDKKILNIKRMRRDADVQVA
jgi:hypothetical protein